MFCSILEYITYESDGFAFIPSFVYICNLITLKILFKTITILDANALDAIFESTLISDIGLQFFISLSSLPFFSISTITV